MNKDILEKVTKELLEMPKEKLEELLKESEERLKEDPAWAEFLAGKFPDWE